MTTERTPLGPKTLSALDEIATEQWTVERDADDGISIYIKTGPHRILHNVNLEDDEMDAVAALPEVVRRLKEAEQERDTLRQQMADLEYQCRHQHHAIGAWMGHDH